MISLVGHLVLKKPLNVTMCIAINHIRLQTIYKKRKTLSEHSRNSQSHDLIQQTLLLDIMQSPHCDLWQVPPTQASCTNFVKFCKLCIVSLFFLVEILHVKFKSNLGAYGRDVIQLLWDLYMQVISELWMGKFPFFM